MSQATQALITTPALPARPVPVTTPALPARPVPVTTPALPARPVPAQSEAKFIESAEYRRLVYKMMRMEVRMPHPGGRISKWPASKAWKHSGQYVEALR